MIDPILDLVRDILKSYRAVAIVLVVAFLGFPFITTGIMWAERIGAFENIYIEQHAEIRNVVVKMADLEQDTNRRVIENQNYMLKMLFVTQGMCINSATNAEERSRCVPPLNLSSQSFH